MHLSSYKAVNSIINIRNMLEMITQQGKICQRKPEELLKSDPRVCSLTLTFIPLGPACPFEPFGPGPPGVPCNDTMARIMTLLLQMAPGDSHLTNSFSFLIYSGGKSHAFSQTHTSNVEILTFSWANHTWYKTVLWAATTKPQESQLILSGAVLLNYNVGWPSPSSELLLHDILGSGWLHWDIIPLWVKSMWVWNYWCAHEAPPQDPRQRPIWPLSDWVASHLISLNLCDVIYRNRTFAYIVTRNKGIGMKT